MDQTLPLITPHCTRAYPRNAFPSSPSIPRPFPSMRLKSAMSVKDSICLRASSHVVQIAAQQRASQAAFMVSPVPVQQSQLQSSYTGSANCDAVISIFQCCEIASPGFDNLCFHDQQSCLCSTSGAWAPSYYDDY